MDAASSVECPQSTKSKMVPDPYKYHGSQDQHQRCTLFESWFKKESKNSSVYHGPNQSPTLTQSVDGSPFQSILGISSLEVAVKNEYKGDFYPFTRTHYDTQDQVKTFLDLTQATAMSQFMIVLILKLVMSPKLPLYAPDYGEDVHNSIQSFMAKYATNLDTHGIPVSFKLYIMIYDMKLTSHAFETLKSM